MVKKKKKNLVSFYGLELEPGEDAQLLKLLEQKGVAAKKLIRILLRNWIKENSNAK